MKPHPLISCVCITKHRSTLLKRAIDCFIAQTYEPKELVILYESDDIATEHIIQQIPSTVRLKSIIADKAEGKKLGNLRNIAIAAASGEYICQWDDDDWYHAERLRYQYKSLEDTDYKGTIISRWLLFDNTTRFAYTSCVRLWEGSILCAKEALIKKEYEDKDRGEDTPVIRFLWARQMLKAIPDMPHLYIYNFHGKNTFEYSHFNGFLRYSDPCPTKVSWEIDKVLHQYPVAKGSSLLDNIFAGYK